MRAIGTGSVEELLDSGQVRRLARSALAAADEAAVAVEIATRDEVERYERKLRRVRWGGLGALGTVLAAAAVGGVNLYYHERAELRRGHEIEPNDTAAEATPLPFGTTITGHLGKRIDATHGDRDFYAVDVPAPWPGETPVVKLGVTALPNFATCTLLYRQGFPTLLGQYCVGRPGRELSIPALRLEPGRYFVAVVQDLDPYGGPPPFIHENVSDAYSVTVSAHTPAGGEEVEPNDQIASANPIVPDMPATGTLGWTHDVDVFCVAGGTPGAIRWKARDTSRDVGSVLEVTPMAGTLEGAPVRVHNGAGKVSATDVQGPWLGAAIPPDGDTPRCLRVRLTPDPWTPGAAMVVPTGGPEPYVIEATR